MVPFVAPKTPRKPAKAEQEFAYITHLLRKKDDKDMETYLKWLAEHDARMRELEKLSDTDEL